MTNPIEHTGMIEPWKGANRWPETDYAYLYYKDKRCKIEESSLRVILHAFIGKAITWYSWQSDYRHFDLLVAPDPKVLDSLPKTKHSISGPLERAAEDLPFAEYAINGEVDKTLDLDPKARDSVIQNPELIKYQITDPGDPSLPLTIEPVDLALLRDLVHCVLLQYSYNINTQVDWSGVLDEITRALETHGEIWVRIMPAWVNLEIRVRRTKPWFLPMFLRKMDSLYISTEDGVATFTMDRADPVRPAAQFNE